MSVIEVNNVTKFYGPHMALNNVSLKVELGQIFALLGPNGAGKTTLVKSILDLVRTSKGEIHLNSKDSRDESARRGVAYLPEKFGFFPYYTVEGVAEFYGKMQGLNGKDLSDQIDLNLSRLNISDLRKKKVNTLSKGQLQRTGIASVLMGNSSLIILDEPFSGLDPIGIKELKDLIISLRDSSKTIFINSHILSEMERVCDHMAILNKGEMLVSGSIEDLIKGESLEDFFYKQVKQ